MGETEDLIKKDQDHGTETSSLLSLLALCILGGAVLLAMILITPPAPQPADAPATEFSAGQAMRDLEVIAREPHPVSPSPAHAAHGCASWPIRNTCAIVG